MHLKAELDISLRDGYSGSSAGGLFRDQVVAGPNCVISGKFPNQGIIDTISFRIVAFVNASVSFSSLWRCLS